jgi:hypothetical protein
VEEVRATALATDARRALVVVAVAATGRPRARAVVVAAIFDTMGGWLIDGGEVVDRVCLRGVRAGAAGGSAGVRACEEKRRGGRGGRGW